MNSANFEERLGEAYELLEEGHIIKASIAFKKLTRLRPKSFQAWVGYGNSACEQGRMDDAECAWRTAGDLEPQNADLLLQLGHRYQCIRQPEKAQEYFEAASAANPSAVNPRICMALLLEKRQRFDEARKEVEHCFAINPADEQARYVSALLFLREDKLEQAECQLRDLIASEPKHEYVRYAARYELAHVLDRTERFDEAMKYLIEAKNLVRMLADPKILARQYDVSAGKLSREARRFPKQILRTWAKTFPTKSRKQIPPIAFLGGHPRSGTTLLEQVLGSHPDIGAIDEPEVTGIAVAACMKQSWGCMSPSLNLARQRYIEALQRALGGESDKKLLLEKNPSPTAVLPALLRVFPELRVIIALRDPRDVVLSCYFQNVPLNQVNSNFLSFDRLVKHYADLMDVWLAVREWEEFAWIETRYEEMVLNLEKEGRRVTEFLGLQWNEGQARFHERSRKKLLYSPTYHDVSKPVYRRSVSRWRRYEKYMAPFLPYLEPYCKKFGYA